MASLHVYLITFNCARNFVNPHTLAPHLFNALPQNAALPDIIALSLQEVAPIAQSFLGGSCLTPYFDRIATTVKLATHLYDGEHDSYQRVFTRNVGMTALMLFAKPALADRIQWIQSAVVGLGLWDMGNKGAVGVRLGLSSNGGDEELAITFAAAHLAPMEDAVQRRNQDWENIVRNLVFINDGKPNKFADDQEPLLSSSSEMPADQNGLYAPGNHIFFAGDLNYRTHNTSPGPKGYHSFPQPTKFESSPNHFSHFLKSDQLAQEREANRTLHGLQELPITFPPTYKYSNKRPIENTTSNPPHSGSDDTDESSRWPWAKHRYPSWCDRILYLPPPPSSPKVQPHIYTSLPLQPTSDHQPVALSVSIKLEPLSRVGDARDLRSNPPFPINKNWKSRRDSARWKELVVGVLAYLTLTRKGNAILVAIAGIAFAGWWMAQWIFHF
ncbi:DNase I-like protein [Glonium stellatum]|uniref:DNase I-like protein n=1 Tax=Glonium stellatum TaxID=574774 RepID=A0A8E2EW61_9PEZI|nr:DNase I-like protein [Glonium stellatum]